jgi:3-methyladenine DNA glycosylase AlkD
MEMFLKIRHQLEQLAEQDYQQFSGSLLPGVEHVLGVRLPQLRKLAGRIAAEDWQQYLAAQPFYFEELMLQGMVIGAIKVPPEERLAYIAAFVPQINNWSVCDSFCSGLKFTTQSPALVWDFLQPYLQSGQEYQIRFAVVMIMDYYLTEDYIRQVLALLAAVRHEGYYVKMAVAWALATALAKQPAVVWPYLQQQQLDVDTWKKTIQKCLESRRIPAEQKEVLRAMRKQFV